MTPREPSHIRLTPEAHGIFIISATPFTDNGALDLESVDPQAISETGH